MVTAVEPTVMHRQALLYYPNEWIRFGQPQPVAVPVNTELVDSRGLFYRQREWPMFSKSHDSEILLSESKAEINNRGLFYQPRFWTQSNASESIFAEPQTRSEKLAANWGLFYRQGEWSMFGRPQKLQTLCETQSETETGVARRGLLHRDRAQELFNSDKPHTIENNARKSGRLQPAIVLAS